MRRVLSGIRLAVFLALGILIVPSSSAGAQMSASIVGSVVDAHDEPVPGASVMLRYRGNVSREFEATTNDNGRFAQLGLQQGPYEIMAGKQGVGFETMGVSLSVGQRVSLTLKLVPVAGDLFEAAPAGLDPESAVSAALQAGAAASLAGNYREAVTLLQQAIQTRPDCHECHHHLGRAYARLEDYTNAEAALTRAIEIDAEHAPAYRELAAIYRAQLRFDEAAEVGARAAELAAKGGRRR